MRVLFIVLTVCTGVWPMVILYFVVALVMKPEPAMPLQSEADVEFYNALATSRPMALNRLRGGLDKLDRRIRRLEDVVTARGYDWERRLNE